jgi:hypothetical protein
VLPSRRTLRQWLDQGSIISSSTLGPLPAGAAETRSASPAGGIVTSPPAFAEVTIFLGYPTLAVMAQRAEHMNMSTSLADDQKRKWIRFKAGANGKTRAR